jgi:small subunit ribosomal protein S16
MVVIRLARGGRKGSPVFKMMVANKRAALGGRFIEKIGTFTPMASTVGKLEVDKDRYDFWISKGAQPSERVKLLMRTLAVGKKPKQPKAKPKAATGEKAATAE